jgi:peptidoglycan/LPS O-acetylase OafA/YrhL
VQTAKWILAANGLQVGSEPPFAVEFFSLKLLALDLLLLQGVGILRMEIHNYPSWSISVEFWLYLIFALLMLAIRSRVLRIVISAAIVALSVAYFVVYWSSVPESLRTLDTRGLPRGLLSFFQGCLLFYFYQRLAAWFERPGGPLRWWTLSAAQAAATALALYLVARQDLLGTWQLLIPFAFTLVVVLLLPDRGLVAALLQTRPVQWIGLHSYSIYLVHVTVLTVLDWPGRAVPEPAKHLVGLVYLGLVFGLSALSYRYIEAPWRDRGRRLAERIEAGETFAGQGSTVQR